MPKEDRKEKSKEKTKGNGNGSRYRDLTISSHDLPHTEVREGCAALNKEENGSNGVGGVGSLLWKVPGSRMVSLCREDMVNKLISRNILSRLTKKSCGS